MTIEALATLVGGRVLGDPTRLIHGPAMLETAGPEHVAFLRDPKYRDRARDTRAGALLVTEAIPTAATQIVVADTNIAFAKISGYFFPPPLAKSHAVHPTVVVGEGCELEAPVAIGPRVVIGNGVRIGAGTTLMPGVTVGDGVTIGRKCVLYANVSLYAGVTLGNQVTIHAGSVIGADGFGYANEAGKWIRFPQIGTVVIGDDVDIGANCAIDRGAIGATRIGRGTKIDNMVHVAHNCVFGNDCAIAAGSFFSGSVVLGDRVTVAGHTVFGGHLKIGNDIRIGGNSGVLEDLSEPGDYMGWPLLPMREYVATRRAMRDLAQMRADWRKRS